MAGELPAVEAADVAETRTVSEMPAGAGDVAETTVMVADGIAVRPVPFSRHADGRAARRNVAPDAVEYVLTHGRRLQRTGVTFYVLGWRDMPEGDRRASWASRLEGTVVLVGEDGEVVTVYRNRRALRAIARKLKHRLPELGYRARRERQHLEAARQTA